MKPRDLAMLGALGAIWGSSYLFIRIAAPALGTLVLVTVRVLLAGGVLLVYALATRQAPELRSRWKPFLALGVINSALPFVLITNAVQHLNASIAAILNATTPLFTALVAAAWLKDSLTARKVAGLALGLTGVAVLVGWSPLPLSAAVLLAAAQSLLAALCYGIGNVLVKVAFKGAKPLTMTIGQQLASGAVLTPFAIIGAPAAQPTTVSVLALLALALLCTAFAYLLYFRLLDSVGPTQTSLVTFLVPFFSLLWGGLLLNEPISVAVLAGLGFILGSVALVTRAARA